LPDRFCTGSSIMPQKKNPDVPELARGKTGRVAGDLVALLTLMKGQALATTRTIKEDRSRCSTRRILCAIRFPFSPSCIAGIQVNVDAMRAAANEGFDHGDRFCRYLVKKGARRSRMLTSGSRGGALARKIGLVWSSCR